MSVYNFETHCFETEKNEVMSNVHFRKTSKGSTIPLSSISTTLNKLDVLSYKFDILRAMYKIVENYGNPEIILYSTNYINTIDNLNLQKIHHNYKNKEDIGTLYKLGKIYTILPNKDTAIKNFLIYVVYRTKLFISERKEQASYPIFDILAKEIDEPYLLKEALCFQIDQIQKFTQNSFLGDFLKKIKNGSHYPEKIQEFIINIIRKFKGSKEKIYIKTLKECLHTIEYFKNNCKIFIDDDSEKLDAYKENSIKDFQENFSQNEKPVVAIKNGNDITIICCNHLIDAHINNTNIKLKSFSQKSPGLLEFQLIIGFIALVVKFGVEIANGYLEHEILELNLDTAKTNNMSAKILKERLLAEYSEFIEEDKVKDLNPSDIETYIDTYLEIIENENFLKQFKNNNPYYEKIFSETKKMVLQALSLDGVSLINISIYY